MDAKKRREFLKNSLKLGAVAGVGVLATQNLLAKNSDQKGVIKGKSKKKEILYKMSQSWENYYNIAY